MDNDDCINLIVPPPVPTYTGVFNETSTPLDLLEGQSEDIREINLDAYIPQSTGSSTNLYGAMEDPYTVGNFTKNDLKQAMDEYDDINVVTQQDSHGRMYYIFDDSITNPLRIIVFQLGDRMMCAINNQVMTMTQLMGIETIQDMDLPHLPAVDKGLGSIRLSPETFRRLHCTTTTGTSFTITNTTLPLLMKALTVFNAEPIVILPPSDRR